MKKSKLLINGTMAFFVFFVSIGNVFASTLDINSVANKFSTTTTVESFTKLGGNITVKVNTDDSTFDIYNDGQKSDSFKYTQDYIEYDNRSTIVTKENCHDNIFTIVWISGIMESIFSLNGYENMTLPDDGDFINNYDSYGIQMETEHYEFEGVENGSSWSSSGEYLKYFKISLDTDKIKTLMDNYGVAVKNEETNEELLKNYTPKLEAKKITENSAVIYSSIPNYSKTNPDNVVYCFIYRSTSKDDSYEKISDMAVNCSDSIGLIDDNLKSNTTYYYKAKIVGYRYNDIGAEFSEPISVTTKSKTNENKNDKVENPKTGVSFPIVITVATGIVAIIILIYSKRKSVFHKI